ncbi:MAG: peptide-methionine (S)-S-oxide reductase [Sphingomonadales bacterium]|jgi:peptide-methionine (S)-S-oxide reductase|nr:peptide-methionine (S)-S-oxide reductase [Sphingomonadales bacterium]
MKKRFLLAALLLAACGQSSADQAEAQRPRPARTETALFAGGCFWSAESDIEHVPGVVEAVSGFAGGRLANPTYEQVTSGRTGHLEAVRVTFDPARISYGQLAARFLRTIDPTDPGGQFCDRGANYRTAIFALNPAQRRAAEAALAEANRILGGRVVTPVRDAAPFYPAEAYHQDYARRNSLSYGLYRRGCGKDARLRAVWGDQAASH